MMRKFSFGLFVIGMLAVAVLMGVTSLKSIHSAEAQDTLGIYNGDGFRGFMQRNGIFVIYANCEDDNCSLIGAVNPFRMASRRSPLVSDINPNDGWYVAAYYLGKDSDEGVADVWQINVYGPEGLVDDGLLFFLEDGILTLISP